MTLKEYLDMYSLSIANFSKILDVSKHHLYQVMQGLRPCSPKFALKIVETTGGKVKYQSIMGLYKKKKARK